MVDKIVELAHKRFAQSEEAESQGRTERLDDIKFVRLGEQWPDAVKRDRERPGAERPMLTINRLFTFRNQVINEIRQNSPSIKCRPVDDDADVDTAKVLQGLIRHIQSASSADIAYDTAVEWQIDTGLGYFRIMTDYCDPDSFDQDIVIKRVVDPNKVYFDPDSTDPDGSDAKWAFVIEDINRDDFEDQYPDVDATGWQEGATGDSVGWYGKDKVRVAEYFYIDTKPRTLALLQDGSTAWKDEIPKEFHGLIEKERNSSSRVCKWVKIGGNAVIDETEMPCSFIPVIPVIGSEVWIEGKRHVHGLTRHAKDPARLYNYMQSANTELLALAPRSPYIAAAGQVEGYENEWQNANRVNLSVLEYNPIDLMGNVLPPPRREPAPGVNPGFEAAMNRSVDDMKSTMGIYDASLGNRESDQSGRAIKSQQQQASIGTFHFSDNLARSIKHAGKIIIEMIPKIYDTQRVARILGEDGTPKNVQLDPNQQQAKVDVEHENGELKSIYNLGVGKYDVVVDVGPSYATKRQEAVEAQMQLVQADPAILQVAGDLIVRNMDWQGAEEIADRMKIMLPPQIQQAEKQGEGAAKIDPQIEQQMNKMADQMQHMSEHIQQLEQSPELEKLEIERFNAQTKRMEVDHKIALESTGLFHEIASAAVAATLQEPNVGETENADNEQQEQDQSPAMVQPTTPGGAQYE